METTRATFSLRWKILAWFFVNLLVLGGILFGFLRVQFRVGISSLLAGSTSDRLEGIALPLAAELRDQPVAEWDASLEQAAVVWRARGLRVGLVWADGSYAAGDIHEVPTEVREAIRQHDLRTRGPVPSHHGGGPPPSGEGDRHGGGRPPGPLPDEENGPNSMMGLPPNDETGGPHGPGGNRDQHDSPSRTEQRHHSRLRPQPTGPLDKFMRVAGDPRLYWAGVDLGEVKRPSPGGPPPSVTLLFASESLHGGGLFFDYTPWLALGVGLVVVSVLMWLPFVHGLTRSLARMTHTAEEIARGHFDPPAVSPRRDELGRLGRALGHMAQRLDGFVTGQKRFLGDTAHELLSPLARLEVALSILEQSAGPEGDHRYTDRALGEVRQMAMLVQDLLSFTKAGMHAPQPAVLTSVGLATLIRQVVEREAAASAVTVNIDETLQVRAEPDLLARALANAIRNAVRYAGQDGPVTITAEPSGDETILLTVADHGPGVPPDAIDRLFDPFFRPEAARTRETGGTGLGLAIVKSCVETCGGQVAVRNRQPSGLELTFTLLRAV